MTTLTLETLQLLQRCLMAQQLSVGAPDFIASSQAAARALVELQGAIEQASSAALPPE